MHRRRLFFMAVMHLEMILLRCLDKYSFINLSSILETDVFYNIISTLQFSTL
jgi:hypothetical protein